MVMEIFGGVSSDFEKETRAREYKDNQGVEPFCPTFAYSPSFLLYCYNFTSHTSSLYLNQRSPKNTPLGLSLSSASDFPIILPYLPNLEGKFFGLI